MTGLYERELWAPTNQAEGLHPEPRTPPSIYFFRLLEENVSQAPPESWSSLRTSSWFPSSSSTSMTGGVFLVSVSTVFWYLRNSAMILILVSSPMSSCFPAAGVTRAWACCSFCWRYSSRRCSSPSLTSRGVGSLEVIVALPGLLPVADWGRGGGGRVVSTSRGAGPPATVE